MTTRRCLLAAGLRNWTACSLAGPLYAFAAAAPAGNEKALAAYENEDQFEQALRRWREASSGMLRRSRPEAAVVAQDSLALAAAPKVMAAPSMAPAGAAESITNVQTAGVDEGGIVKHAGAFLVILRRGRLFTVRVGGNALEPVAMADAYAPGSDPQGAWYDELLIAGSTVVVVGYSYARGGTEIGLFRLERDGSLRHRSTHHLRSFDYYSSRNYASRLIGRKLIFYAPSHLRPWDERPWEQLPGLRRWQGADTPAEFRRILPATRIFRTDDEFAPGEPLALHTVTQIDLDTPGLEAESMAVLAPAGRVFYVSQSAVYVWTSARAGRGPGSPPDEPRPEERNLSAVFRLPLDGGAPRALKTAGVPIDQMSFLEDDGGHLNVLLRESGSGEGMWGSEHTRGSMALLRVALAEFGNGQAAARPEHYRRVPAPARGAVQNRFVGDWLLWGSEKGGPWRAEGRGAAGWALRFALPADAQPLQPGHGIERIEALGRDAVLVGRAGADLCFTSVDLGRQGTRIIDRHVLLQAAQGETRSHGFFYRPTSGDEGLLGLPVLGPRSGERPGQHGRGPGAASVVVLRQRALRFVSLGHLDATARPPRDDVCKASCVDWYGNARPIFLGDRVFALLGYELVEGRIEADAEGERLEELQRVNFSPRPRPAPNGRAWPFD